MHCGPMGGMHPCSMFMLMPVCMSVLQVDAHDLERQQQLREASEELHRQRVVRAALEEEAGAINSL